VLKLARRWEALDSTQRHDLRKRAKKLRYSIEFFASIFKPKRVERYLTKLQELQAALGSANDAVTARALLDTLRSDEPALAEIRGATIGWLAAESRRVEQDVPELLAHLQKTRKFWRDSLRE